MATQHPQVSPDILSKLQLTCLDLPEAHEQAAWLGTRWMVGKKNFAHVLMIAGGYPPAYAKVARTGGPACVLTSRTRGPAVENRLGQGAGAGVVVDRGGISGHLTRVATSLEEPIRPTTPRSSARPRR